MAGNMYETAKPSWCLAGSALIVGLLGELFSPFLLPYGVDRVIASQILLFGLILLGLYAGENETLRREGVIQSPSAPVPENADAETLGASTEELQASFYRKIWDRTWFLTVLVGGLLTILLMPSNPYVSFTVSLLATSSLVTGMYCAVAAPFLRIGRAIHDRAMANFSFAILVVLPLVFAFVQRYAYLDISGDIALVDYMDLARFSRSALLASAALGLLLLRLVTHFSGPRYHRTL